MNSTTSILERINNLLPPEKRVAIPAPAPKESIVVDRILINDVSKLVGKMQEAAPLPKHAVVSGNNEIFFSDDQYEKYIVVYPVNPYYNKLLKWCNSTDWASFNFSGLIRGWAYLDSGQSYKETFPIKLNIYLHAKMRTEDLWKGFREYFDKDSQIKSPGEVAFETAKQAIAEKAIEKKIKVDTSTKSVDSEQYVYTEFDNMRFYTKPTVAFYMRSSHPLFSSLNMWLKSPSSRQNIEAENKFFIDNIFHAKIEKSGTTVRVNINPTKFWEALKPMLQNLKSNSLVGKFNIKGEYVLETSPDKKYHCFACGKPNSVTSPKGRCSKECQENVQFLTSGVAVVGHMADLIDRYGHLAVTTLSNSPKDGKFTNISPVRQNGIHRIYFNRNYMPYTGNEREALEERWVELRRFLLTCEIKDKLHSGDPALREEARKTLAVQGVYVGKNPIKITIPKMDKLPTFVHNHVPSSPVAEKHGEAEANALLKAAQDFAFGSLGYSAAQIAQGQKIIDDQIARACSTVNKACDNLASTIFVADKNWHLPSIDQMIALAQDAIKKDMCETFSEYYYKDREYKLSDPLLEVEVDTDIPALIEDLAGWIGDDYDIEVDQEKLKVMTTINDVATYVTDRVLEKPDWWKNGLKTFRLA